MTILGGRGFNTYNGNKERRRGSAMSRWKGWGLRTEYGGRTSVRTGVDRA
jgi:hypothetical protein